MQSGTPDVAQLRATMLTIEQACSSIQMHVNPTAAEASIFSLCRSPRPYQACKYILENSRFPDARFQAAGAIREAAVREWTVLTPEDKGSLISFCLCYVMQRATSDQGYVLAKVGSVAAQLLKRGWLEFTVAEKEAIFLQVRHAITGSHGIDVQFGGLVFLESLVSEFSPSTSSAMGLPKEFHDQCQASLEKDYLKTLYCWCQEAATNVTDKIVRSDSDIPEGRVCLASLRLMLQILNWDFLHHKSNVLITGGNIGWVLNLYSALRQKGGDWLDCTLAESARKLIIQLCSVAGIVLPSDNGQHLPQLLCGVIDWMDPPNAIVKAIQNGKSSSEFLDGCRALLSMATVTSPIIFDQLLKSIRPYGSLYLVSTLMGETIKDLVENRTEEEEDEETWSWVARDILLETWTTVLMPLDTSSRDSFLKPEGISAAAHLFSLLVESELKVASIGSMDDERLSSYALIGRAAADITVPFLSRLFSERFAKLQQMRGGGDPTKTMEELYSLLLITGHVLADEGLGETPLVPMAIQTQFKEDFVPHPVVVLSGSIINFAEQSLDAEMRRLFFSPRLMEAVVWFLARWSSTYLMSEESKGSLLRVFEEHDKGKYILDAIVRIATATLVSYPFEKDLQDQNCFQLLHGLTRTRSVCQHLFSLESWRNLSNAFTSERILLSLNPIHQRSLAQTLALSASCMEEEANLLVRNLTNHMTAYLLQLSSQESSRQQPDTILLLTCLFERLRGVASASETPAQKAVYEMGNSIMNPILIFLDFYRHESALIHLLLKFVAEWVDGQTPFLEARETETVIEFCMRLLQVYSTSLPQNKAETEKYKHSRALLQLLADLCSKDVSSKVVYTGFQTVITPLITQEVLKYPKLCHDYFTLVSQLLSVYPEMIVRLNKEHIVASLEFGLHHQDSEVVRLCLQALRGLASYHYKKTAAASQEGILGHFLRSLMQILLFEDYSSDLVGSAADALLPLMLCEQGLYQRLGNELIQGLGNQSFKSRLADALHSLTSANNLSPTLDRVNYQRFRKNLHNFLIQVRPFLRIL